MKTTDIRKLSTQEINAKIVELKEELFDLKFKLAIGQLEKTARVNVVKKTIARMKTILTERAE